LYKVYQRPNVKANIVDFDYPEDFFNVKKNLLWGNGKYTISGFFNQIKLMMTKEAILHAKDIYGASFNWPVATSLTKTVELFPADKLWTLLFIGIEDTHVYHRKHVASEGRQGWAIGHHDNIDLNPRWTSAERGKEGVASIATLLKASAMVEAEWNEMERLYGDKFLYNVNLGPTMFNHVLSYLPIYADDREMMYLASPDGRADQKVKPSVIYATENLKFDTRRNKWGHYIGTITVSYATRATLYKQMQYSANVLQYLEPKKLDEEPDNVLKYGVELELSTNYSVKQLIDACDDPFFIVKADSSVRGNKRYPYELVTPPMSALSQKVYWAQWLDALDYGEFDTTLDTTNGMHVHIGSDSFKNKSHRERFIYFYTRPQNTEFFLRFSARDLQSFKRYCPVPNIPLGYTEQNVMENLDVILENMPRDDRGNHLRGIVGASKKGGTIEVRLFRGVVSMADIAKNLEMVEASFLYAKDTPNMKDMTLKGFLNFVFGQPDDTWEILKEYLNTLDLEYATSYAEVFDIVFAETRPDVISELIRNAPNFQINDSHITCLNIHFGRQVFGYKNGQVRVKALNTSSSAVARFDGIVSAKYNKKRPLKNIRGKQAAPDPFVDEAAVPPHPWGQRAYNYNFQEVMNRGDGHIAPAAPPQAPRRGNYPGGRTYNEYLEFVRMQEAAMRLGIIDDIEIER